MGLFRRFSAERELEELRKEFDSLKRSFAQIQQEWDATVDRVAKTLRRIRRAEQAAEAVEEPEETKEPLTSIATSGDRMARIRSQLAAAKKGT